MWNIIKSLLVFVLAVLFCYFGIREFADAVADKQPDTTITAEPEGFKKYARVDTLTGPDGCTYAVLVHENLGESVLPALTHSPKCNNH